MPIARLIFVTVAPQDATEAHRIWKEDCAPLMIKQEGCLSEELLQAVDSPGELISYSEWADVEAIRRYEASPDHAQIERHVERLRATQPPVTKLYQVAG